MIDLHETVQEAMQKWPQTFSVFTRYKTKCPGCFMQPFCTLRDVAEMYHIPLDNLMDEIKDVASQG